MPIRCEIVSQDRMVYQGDVDMVVLPGASGEMGILPQPLPCIDRFEVWCCSRSERGEEQHFTVAGGVAEVQPDQVTVLADAAENVEEIDIQRAEAARRRAEDLLKQGFAQTQISIFKFKRIAALEPAHRRCPGATVKVAVRSIKLLPGREKTGYACL